MNIAKPTLTLIIAKRVMSKVFRLSKIKKQKCYTHKKAFVI